MFRNCDQVKHKAVCSASWNLGHLDVATFGCMVFMIIPKFRILRLTLYGKMASKCCIRLNLKASLGFNLVIY